MVYMDPDDFWHKRKINNFDPYNVFLAIATNIPQRLKTSFVLQGQKILCACACACACLSSTDNHNTFKLTDLLTKLMKLTQNCLNSQNIFVSNFI